jgi:hypothetical protein
MVGIGEAWRINKIVLVSPAVFQLLTDIEDFETLFTVARQIKLKPVTWEGLKSLVIKRWHTVPSDNFNHSTVHYKINSYTEPRPV